MTISTTRTEHLARSVANKPPGSSIVANQYCSSCARDERCSVQRARPGDEHDGVAAVKPGTPENCGQI
jgi:hypothetical protein